MKCTIVYDNDVYIKEARLQSDWGFSCLLEMKDETLLFDTGAKGTILLHNMQELGIDITCISKIVLSHEHWDHTGGLSAVAQRLPEVEIFRIGSNTLDNTTASVQIEKEQKIAKDVYSTGKLSNSVDEQSLIIHGTKGWWVLVGCSHPGVKQILTIAKKYGTIYGLVGGFHGFNVFSVLKPLQVICHCHCTEFKKDILQEFPKTATKGGVGKEIIL